MLMMMMLMVRRDFGANQSSRINKNKLPNREWSPDFFILLVIRCTTPTYRVWYVWYGMVPYGDDIRYDPDHSLTLFRSLSHLHFSSGWIEDD